MEKIIQEKISADHLLYVSMKYTKTTDVILNLLARWKSLIESSIDRLLEHSKKKKVIGEVSIIPKLKVESIKKIYRKDSDIIEAINLYEFFKKIDSLEKIRENEFRKNVNLKVLLAGKWIDINMDKLKEYSEVIERFIMRIKQIL